jgi:N-acetyl-anhydromuramyl-L-alanine amidase AmpD
MTEIKAIYKEARFYNRSIVVSSWNWIVIHCTESAKEDANRAIKVADWFQNPWDPAKKSWRKASAHFVVDDASIVQCVPTNRIAYHARGLNNRALGIELVGKAKQSREEWLDDFGEKMIGIASALVAVLAEKHCIQLNTAITNSGILLGNGGITTHGEVTKACKIPHGHTDPGLNFPMDELLRLAREQMEALRCPKV